jgi:hypothetical protein
MQTNSFLLLLEQKVSHSNGFSRSFHPDI